MRRKENGNKVNCGWTKEAHLMNGDCFVAVEWWSEGVKLHIW